MPTEPEVHREAPPAQPLKRKRFYRNYLFQRVAAAVLLVAVLAFVGVYIHYARVVSEHVGQGNVLIGTMVFSRPLVLHKGDPFAEADVIRHLERCGYRADGNTRMGQFRRTQGGLEIVTGPDSYFQNHTVRLQFSAGKIRRIFSATNNTESDEVALEPEMVTNLVSGDREKRRPVQYAELPKHLIEALVSTEDKRFFDHGGLDILRVAKAAYVDLKERRKEQGASTLTMQLARSFYLDQEKTWRRKISEVFISAELERRFSKEEILTLYANEVYLGRRGSFSIHGFGQAARSYFGKEVKQLTLPEAALLVGMIQRPAYFNPFKYPERAKQRRDLVLTLMFNNGYLDAQSLSATQNTPVKLTPGETEFTEAPYFVDLLNAEVDHVLGEEQVPGGSLRVYTGLDMELQRLATEAIKAAMPEVDRNARAKNRGKKELPQVALVALDPHTGAVRALVGGRNYAESQLNRTLAKRPPGSSFKPFVYAAALMTAVENDGKGITPATRVLDAPTVFRYANQTYEPGNFDKSFHGNVTLRQALTKSLNVATVKLAEQTGYERVVKLARAAGMNQNLQPTPSLALGAYEVTPLEIARAYTIFSNGGKLAKSYFMDSARDRNNRVIYSNSDEAKPVLDERVAYIMTNMMEDVITRGTAASARGRGFTDPAAGKTGTSHDGWFAGFTSNLLTVVWVGYDDYTELKLEGSKSALPVWVEFMKRAHKLPQYSNTDEFHAPKGIVRIGICNDTGLRATEYCWNTRTEVFVSGTQPKSACTGEHEPEYVDDPELAGQEAQRQGIFGRVLGVFR